MHSARCGGSRVGDGIVARRWSLPPQPLLDLRLNGIQAHILPAILDLDVGKCEAVLEGSGHLFEISGAFYQSRSYRLAAGIPWRPEPAAAPSWQPHPAPAGGRPP